MRVVFPYPKSPCKDCPDRHIGCHSQCEKYKVFAEDNKQVQYEIRKVVDRENSLNAYEMQRAKRIRERKKHY